MVVVVVWCMRQTFRDNKLTAAIFAVLALVMAYSWMSPEISAPNERTRIYLSLSLLESGSIQVDDQVKQFGKPFDISEREGHFYTDKAPGSSWMGLPFLAAYKVLGGDMNSIEKMTNFMRMWMMVPLSLLTLWLFRYLVLGLGVASALANRAAVVLVLGTSFLHYGAAFYGHALVTFWTLGAAVAMWKSMPRRPAQDTVSEEEHLALPALGWITLAGFCAGMAFAVEYQAVVVFLGLFLGFLTCKHNRRLLPVLALGLGTLGPVACALGYNFIAFGNPLATSYDNLHHQASQSNHDHGLFGIELPSLETLYGLLLSPSRGLLFCALFVLLGVAGLVLLWKRARWLAVYCGTLMALYFLLVAGGKDFWFGGWSFGPRLLVPMFGLAAISATLLYEKIEARGGAVAGGLYGVFVASILYNVFVVSMFPELPPEFKSPFTSIAMPLAALGAPSPNLGMKLFGLSGLASLAPLALLVLGLCLYLVWPAWKQTGTQRLTLLAGMLLTFCLFSGWVASYPEQASEKKATGFVEWVSRLRTEAR